MQKLDHAIRRERDVLIMTLRLYYFDQDSTYDMAQVAVCSILTVYLLANGSIYGQTRRPIVASIFWSVHVYAFAPTLRLLAMARKGT